MLKRARLGDRLKIGAETVFTTISFCPLTMPACIVGDRMSSCLPNSLASTARKACAWTATDLARNSPLIQNLLDSGSRRSFADGAISIGWTAQGHGSMAPAHLPGCREDTRIATRRTVAKLDGRRTSAAPARAAASDSLPSSGKIGAARSGSTAASGKASSRNYSELQEDRGRPVAHGAGKVHAGDSAVHPATANGSMRRPGPF